MLHLRGRFVGLSPARRGLYLERLMGEPARFSALVRLFLFGLPVPADEVAVPLERLCDLDLVRVEDGVAVSRARFAPHAGLLLAAESGDWHEEDAAEDVVPGLSNAGLTAAALTPRAPVRRVLDLGTGFGLHALLASRHAKEVVGVDVNPRALSFARLNVELNDIDNVELREGDLFEPVAGERFDLVVSNPPFVVGPDRRYVFRDGGPQFCARVLRGVRAVLAEGGVAVVMVGWGHGGHDVWRTPRGWVEEIGCDAAILRFADLDLLGNGWLHTRDADVAARWAGALDSAGIARVAYGAVLLRRRVGGGRVATIDAVGKDVPACGAQMLRILANLEWLDANEQALASARFAPAGDLELRTSEQLGASSDAPRPTRLALRRGLPLTVEADDALVAAIRRGSAEGDPSLTPRLRELLELGFLAGG